MGFGEGEGGVGMFSPRNVAADLDGVPELSASAFDRNFTIVRVEYSDSWLTKVGDKGAWSVSLCPWSFR